MDTWDWDLVLIKTAGKRVEKVNEREFVGGSLSARALVWSYREHRVLCMVDLDLQLQKVTSRSGGDDAALRGDVSLMYSAFETARDTLVLAGPPQIGEPETRRVPTRR